MKILLICSTIPQIILAVIIGFGALVVTTLNDSRDAATQQNAEGAFSIIVLLTLLVMGLAVFGMRLSTRWYQLLIIAANIIVFVLGARHYL